MTNYARLYRFGITPWERYRTAAAASITALLDREETGRSRPLGRALDLGCGRGQYTPELARRGWEAVGIDYVPAAIQAAAAKGGGRSRAQLCHRRRDAAAVGPPGKVRLLPRHRLLPGPGRRTASRPRERCLGTGQPRGHLAAAELRPEPVAAAGRRRIAGGGPDRLRGLGDARGRPGGHRRLGLADEQDRATLVQAAPADLERDCLVEPDWDCRTAGIAWMPVPVSPPAIPGGCRADGDTGQRPLSSRSRVRDAGPGPPSGNVSGTAPG